MKGKRVSVEEIVRRISQVHGDVLCLDISTYVGTQQKCRFIDKDFGEWWAKPSNVYQLNQSHPDRAKIEGAKNRTIFASEISKRLWNIRGDELVMDESTYVNTTVRARFVDKDYGEFWGTPGNVMNGCGHKTRRYKKNADKSTMSAEEVQLKLNILYGDIVILKKETYVNTHVVATFIDKDYGEWETTPNSVLSGHLNYKRGSEKRQKTNTIKYGVPFVSQDPEIALKQSRSGKRSYIKYYWKTGEELVCQGSYEAKTVDYLNSNNIDFDWQPKIFKMPDNKTYRPDLYLIDTDIWIEIKGRFRVVDKQKWDWFKSEYPTAELWDKKKLKDMGIL